MTTSPKRQNDVRSSQKRSGVLTEKEIRHLNLIERGMEDFYQPASYDLRLGDEHLFPKASGNRSTENIIANSQGEKILKIPAFGSVIVTTLEWVHLPQNILARFNLRIKVALRGLFVQMGTQVEPGYYGILSALVHNVSSVPVEIAIEKEAFFTIEFHYIGCDADVVLRAEPVRNLNSWLGNQQIFTRGMLGDIVTTAKLDAASAVQIAKGAEKTAVQATQLADDASRDVKKINEKRHLYWGFFLAVIASAILPLTIAFATARFNPIPKEIEQLIEEKIIARSSNSFANNDSDAAKAQLQEATKSLEKIQAQVVELQNQIKQMKELMLKQQVAKTPEEATP